MNLLVIRDGIDSRMLETEIAGHRIEEHLAHNAQPQFSVPELKGAFGADSPALYVRADAWFTRNALNALAARLSQRMATAAAFVTASGSILAACLAATEAKLLGTELKSSPWDQALSRVIDQVANCMTFEATELDADSPPQVVANMLDAALIEKRISFVRARTAMLQGARIRDPDRISIRGELTCGLGVEIEVDVIIEGRVTLGDGVKIGAGCIISHATIGNDSRINPYSIVEHAAIGANSFVGPYGRVRPGSTIGDRVQIGNFVEIKQSLIGDASRINHLAFIGDATLGSMVTIGAGVITCNHDGRGVNPTRIGAGAYIGSGTELVAPLSVGENAVIGAGSTITRDAPAGKLTIARTRQVTVESGPRPERGADQN